MSFQENLRKYLKSKDLSQKRAAEMIGYTTVNFNHYLGDRDPNFDLIMNLIKAFPDIDLNYLFKGTKINAGVNFLEEPPTEYLSEDEKIISEIEEKLQQLKSNLSRK